ncbi:MAG: FG-GAP repeat domain-containing protein, partial [Gemmatimonadota bacterium]
MVWDAYPERALAMDSVTREVDGELRVRPEFREYCRLDTTEAGPACEWIGEEDRLYLNDGSGRFRAADWTGGRFRTAGGEPLERAPRDWGLTARFHDLNGDGRPDLWVCNDFRSPDRIWLNRGGGRFRAAPELSVRSTSMSCMAVDFSDVDRDGDTDGYASDMLAPPGPRRKTQQHTYDPAPTPPGRIRTRVQKNHNTLQVNRGDGTFAELARARDAEASGWTWGTMFLDVDLDGREDLLLANGHRWDQL